MDDVYRNVDLKTRDVYHENVCMSEALSLHSARVEELETRTQKLEQANRLDWTDKAWGPIPTCDAVQATSTGP